MVRRYRKRGGARRGRRGGLRKRMYRKGLGVTPLRKTVHWFKEQAQISSLTCLANNDAYGTMVFQWAALNNIASFRNLFDLYKLTGVKVKIVPRFSVGESSVAGGTNALGQMGNLPMLYIAENRDVYVPAPTSIPDVLNDDGCKVIRLTKPVNLYLKNPKAALQDSEGHNMPFQFNSSSKALQPWLTTGGNAQIIDQSAVPHYGFRWAINNLSGNPLSLDVYATYYFSCKEQD